MKNLDDTFAALSDETRRAILKRLCDGEIQLSELAKPFAMTQTAVSKHIKVLSNAGLVTVEKRGRIRFCKLNAQAMKDASDWLSGYQQFWLNELDNLGQYFVEEKNKK